MGRVRETRGSEANKVRLNKTPHAKWRQGFASCMDQKYRLDSFNPKTKRQFINLPQT